MTLRQAELGRSVLIRRLENLSETELMRLSALGLRAGAHITKLLKTPLRDPIECLVGPQLLAVEAWLLDRIIVDA